MNFHIIERISWKCKKNSFLDRGGVVFDDVPDAIQMVVENYLFNDETPVVAMFNADSWTVITDASIITSFNSRITKILHSEIHHTATFGGAEGADKIERIDNTTKILVGKNCTPVWTLGGRSCLSMMNLIMMFPLNSGNLPQ